MTVSAIIIRADDAARVARLRTLLEEEPRCMPGPSRGGALAAVLEFETAEEGEDLHGWLHRLPGVCGVSMVSTLHHHEDSILHEGVPT